MDKYNMIYKGSFFEIDNARNLSKKQLVSTFIPTTVFFRLLSRKHHIIFGARGQGKTAIAKMISFDHLSSYGVSNETIKQIVDKQEYIGMYLPTKLEWVGSLQTKMWNSKAEKEGFFQWKVNLSSCLSFLTTAQACINYYIRNEYECINIERKLCKELALDWGIETSVYNFQEIKKQLETINHLHQMQMLKDRILNQEEAKKIGIAFLDDLFVPLKRAIAVLMHLSKIDSNCAWLLCVDEAEFLDADCQKILNSFMRTSSDNLFLKITTMPFCHYTLATVNRDAELNAGQDFEYISMDNDFIITKEGICNDFEESQIKFGALLFKKICDSKFDASFPDDAIFQLLGESILDGKTNADSNDMDLINLFASSKTKQRAAKLLSESKQRFHNEISRKMHGALLLREAVLKCVGNTSLSIYSGATMFIRCAENNPRRLIRLFNLLFIRLKDYNGLSQKKDSVLLPANTQTETLVSFSETTLNQIRSLEEVGPQLYELLNRIGQYMKYVLHKRPLTTDQISSIETTDDISDFDWKLIQKAVGQGLLVTNSPGSINYGVAAVRAGKYHLAYILSPHFKLLPRRGKSVRLSSIADFDYEHACRALNDTQDYSDDLFSNLEDDNEE